MSPLSLAKDIYPIITSTSGTATFMSREMQDCFTVDGTLYKCRWLVFENVTFINQVFLRDLSFGVGIKFVNCSFEGTFAFQNVTSSGEDFVFDHQKRGVVFENCTFKKRFEIKGGGTIAENGIFVLGSKFEDYVEIDGISIGHSGLNFKSCNFEGYVNTERCTFKGITSFWLCTFNGTFGMKGCNVNNLTISENSFNGLCFFENNFFKIGVSFFESDFKHGASIQKNSGHVLTLMGGVFHNTVEISHHDENDAGSKKFENVRIENCSFHNGLFLSGKNNFIPVGSVTEMRNITIVCSNRLTGNIHIDNFFVNYLTIQGVNSAANILFEQIWVCDIHIDNFFNYGQFVLSNLNASGLLESDKTLLHICQSNLGKAHIFQTDLSQFSRVEIRNVILSEIITSNVTWFRHENLFDEALLTLPEDLTFQLDHYSVNREMYRQLKYAMEKNGDRPQALIFQSLEMNYYRKVLKRQKVTTYRNKWQLLGDKIILATSLSNDFGQNWIKPIRYLFIFATIAYVPVAMFASGELSFAPAASMQELTKTIKVIVSQLHLWPQLLNPAHNLSGMLDKEIKVSGWIYFFDFFHRIITAYFIFQIVTAFRKYVR